MPQSKIINVRPPVKSEIIGYRVRYDNVKGIWKEGLCVGWDPSPTINHAHDGDYLLIAPADGSNRIHRHRNAIEIIYE